jgi:hypothetical protein
MAKSWLMLEQGLLARPSRLILRQSIGHFDSRLKELEVQTSGTENQAAWAELAGLWPRYRALLEVPPNPADAQELFAINEDVLEAADQLARGFAKTVGTRKGQLVNLAGRARMLSQLAAKHFMFRQMGIHVDDCRSRLEDANAEFAATLAELRASALNDPGFAARLESIFNLWKLFRSAMDMHDPERFPAGGAQGLPHQRRLAQPHRRDGRTLCRISRRQGLQADAGNSYGVGNQAAGSAPMAYSAIAASTASTSPTGAASSMTKPS